jgi:hypothetical protein
MRTLFVFVAFICAAFAQRHKVEDIDTEKPGGKLVQQILQESDGAKRKALLEQFTTEYPKHEGAAWALEQLQQIAVKAGDADQILAAGDKLLAIDPNDPEAGLQNLKAAQTKKDYALMKNYAIATSAAARKLAPTDAANAKYFQDNADFALYSAIVESRDPKVTINLAETLRRESPKGEYTQKAIQPLFVAYQQSGDRAKALEVAEQSLASDQSSEDMLLVVADAYAQQKKDPQKVHEYSAKAAEVAAQRPKPEGVSDADWNSHKNAVIGVARYLNGKLYYTENNFAKADGELRIALPVADPKLKAEVLYMLGFSNYKLDKPQEAANFYRACAALPGQFQPLATKNLAAIRTQYTGIK